ncbi:MAG: DUF3500 domain-containing protein [Planctomycetia bacterium]
MQTDFDRPLSRAAWITGAIGAIGLVVAGARATAPAIGAGGAMTAAAHSWIATLDTAQKERAVRPFDEASRVDWHFIPKPARKGVQLRDMTPPQQTAALALLRAALSQAGYDKSVVIMELDEILRILEGAKAKNIRDPKRYFFTVFGTPAEKGRWGLSVEGHHLSLNFTVRDGALVDTTPQCMGANPAVVKTTLPNLPKAGTRVLAEEETLAFDLVKSLDPARKQKAVTAPEPPKEVRAAGVPQPPNEPLVGIALSDLSADQAAVLKKLVDVYCGAMPAEVAAERRRLIEAAPGGWAAVRFAWQGPLEPGIGHAYRIEGPTFSIEFVNVQPDAEGNPANHIHCIWRDRTGDFDLPPAA